MEPENPNTDANTDGAPSTPSTEQPDATGAQTPSKPAAEPTLAQVAKEAYEKSTSSQEDKAGDVPNADKTEDPNGEPAAEEPADEPAESLDNADKDVPFHDHPRWQEVTKKAKDLEANLKEVTERTKDWEASAQRVQYHDAYMQQNGISNEDFQQAMSFLALKQSDPAAARAMFKSQWDSLASFDEGFIPADIQKEINGIEQAVKDSEISRPLADKQIALLKETAKNKVQQQSAQLRTQKTAEQQQRAVAQSIGTTLQSWESSTAKKDPGFKPKAKPESKDGVYEITCAKYAYMANMNPPRTAAEASTLAEKAYKEARELLAPAKPAPQPKLNSQRSSTAKQNGEPKTIADTVASVAAKHGYSWSPKKRN